MTVRDLGLRWEDLARWRGWRIGWNHPAWQYEVYVRASWDRGAPDYVIQVGDFRTLPFGADVRRRAVSLAFRRGAGFRGVAA
jgi:hypothetical protein